MVKRLLNLVLMLLAISQFTVMAAESGEAVIKFKSVAPEGTKLRIMTVPYGESAITGAKAGEFLGEYLVEAPGAEITLTGAVEQLEVYGCQLSELVVESAPDMMILKCYDNSLEALNTDNCPNLQVLDCKNNNITSLDVTANPLLEQLNASSNQLTEISIGVSENLSQLYLGNNRLSGADLSGCSALTDLRIENNQLSVLDLGANTKLTEIRVYGNRFAGAAMDSFIEKLPQAVTSPSLLWIVDTRNEDDGNACLRKNVVEAAAKGWASWDYAGGTNDGAGVYYYGADYVPEVTDQTITLTTSRNVGETITLEISAPGDITISGVAESSGFTGKNTFTLTSQTVEVKGAVSMFECPGNDVTSLTFGGDIDITYLDCKNNKIESLDLNGASVLATLYASDNNISSLNLEGCNALLRVDCYLNNLKGAAMTAMMNSLRTAADGPYLFVIDTKAPTADRNVALKSDVAIATGKGWAVFDYVNGDRYGMGERYEGSDPVEPVKPEQYFTVGRQTKDHMIINVEFADQSYEPIVEGATVSGWNGSQLTISMTDETVKVYGDAVMLNMIYTFIDEIDVTNLPNLTELNIGLDDIAVLDLSGNAKLQSLSCEGNLLETLDLSSCPDLTYLNCYGNRIKESAMTAMINSLPQRTADNSGTLIVYDSSYGYEENVCLSSDVQLARGKYWAVYELVDNEPVQYDGEDPTGIDDITVEGAVLSYDMKSETISTTNEVDIHVYALSGRLVSTGVKSVRIDHLPSGVYVASAAGKRLKVVK